MTTLIFRYRGVPSLSAQGTIAQPRSIVAGIKMSLQPSVFELANPHYLLKPETKNHGEKLAAADSIDATRARNKRIMQLFCDGDDAIFNRSTPLPKDVHIPHPVDLEERVRRVYYPAVPDAVKGTLKLPSQATPSVIYDRQHGETLGFTDEELLSFSISDLEEKGVDILAFCNTYAELKSTVKGRCCYNKGNKDCFTGLTDSKIVRGDMLVVPYSPYAANSVSAHLLVTSMDSHQRLKEIRRIATRIGKGCKPISVVDHATSDVLAKFDTITDASKILPVNSGTLSQWFKDTTEEATRSIRGLPTLKITVHIGAASLRKYDSLQVVHDGGQRLEAICGSEESQKEKKEKKERILERMNEAYASSGGVLSEEIILSLKDIKTKRDLQIFWNNKKVNAALKAKRASKKKVAEENEAVMTSKPAAAVKSVMAKKVPPAKEEPAKKKAPTKKKAPIRKKANKHESSDEESAGSYSSSDGSDSEVEVIFAPAPGRERRERVAVKKATYVFDDRIEDDESDADSD